MTQFNTLGLSEITLAALAAKGYTEATPIQAQSIPALLEGRDLLGIAQTGTGKTAAFMLPSIERLVASNQRAQPRGCRMLVLAPTRELASQIADSARQYSKGTKLSVATVFGGTSIHKNKTDLARGVDIVVATPGRLVDLIDQCYAILLGIEILVLDEADQMMDLGFIHALKRIVRELPSKRQTLFFSATMPKSIRELAGQFIKDPVEVKVTPVATTAERVEQFVTHVSQTEKQSLLTIHLRDESIDRALVFTRTKHGADRVVKLLAGNGIASNAIHGNKSQPQRERALAEFKSGKVKVLIATDIAARGIDVSGVSHVFNFELPNVPDQYVHRIGRTARAGATGIAISYCADDERTYLRDIERLIRQKITAQTLPEGFVAESAKIKSTRAPVAIGRDEQNGRNGRAMQDRGGQRNGANHRGPRANPHGGKPGEPRRHGEQRATHAGDRPQGERPARPEGQRQTLGASFGGREGGDQRPQGDRPRFYGPRKKNFSARPASGGGQRGGQR